jgi:hypothetical protein
MRDLIKDFAQNEKIITQYVMDRRQHYENSKCKSTLKKRIARLNESWDMEVGSSGGGRKDNRQQFLAQLSYPLVKQQMLTRRAIFTNNFRADPLFTVKPIGNTPAVNAVNMQDLIEANNKQIEFRSKVLRPAISHTVRWGASVVYTEYCNNKEMGWRTTADPVFGSTRVYGPVKSTINALCHTINPLNYFQNPDVVSCDNAGYRGHTERRTLAWFINRVKQNENLYIKENVEEIIKRVMKENSLDKDHFDPTGKQSRGDFDKVAINDIVRGQFQIHIDGNEDDPTYYYVEIVGDKIVRFQDNPYDLNMNQYTVLTCEPRDEFWWGNTPAEYSLANEDRLNLLLGLGVENALESMKRYVFYNKNAINPSVWNHVSSNGKIPVDVNRDISLNNLLWTYQVPDQSSQALNDAYARIMENDQRVSTNPDLSRPTAAGGTSNKTATAANILTNKGDIQDADILEQFSDCLKGIPKNQSIILSQFLGNFGPILVRPENQERMRMINKEALLGNYQFSMETALTTSYQGEMMRYQNIVTWLLNLVNGGLPIQPKFEPIIKQVLKMGQFTQIDEIMPDQIPMQQGQLQMPGGVQLAAPMQQAAPVPEMAGVA